MTTEQLIAIEVFATHQGVDAAFIRSLHERGLIHVTLVREEHFVDAAELARIEQLTRLHYDLDINLEGIEAISHMLERMDAAQEDLRTLRERLRLYEGDQP
jgi:chaperone modulatory protein CbpM